MPYATLEQLLQRPGAVELAQVATPENKPVVDALLLEATLRGADRAAWAAEARAVADAALARINDALADADARIDGFLQQRGYALPLNPVPGIVAGWSRDIARYLLHKDRIQDEKIDPIARAYRDAMALLKQLADGKFSLSAAPDAAPAAARDLPEFIAGGRTFDAGTLRDF